METRPDCPDCGNPLSRPFESCHCGWRSRRIQKAQPKRLCQWDDHGLSCAAAGHMSTGTTGDGPWYCRDHFADLMGWQRWTVDGNLPIPRRRLPLIIEGESSK